MEHPKKISLGLIKIWKLKVPVFVFILLASFIFLLFSFGFLFEADFPQLNINTNFTFLIGFKVHSILAINICYNLEPILLHFLKFCDFITQLFSLYYQTCTIWLWIRFCLSSSLSYSVIALEFPKLCSSILFCSKSSLKHLTKSN